MTNKCSQCGAPLNNGICDYCGNQTDKIIHEKVYSGKFEQYENEDKFQDFNNNQRNKQYTNEFGVSKKSRTVALLLCIFTGTLGIHKFYVGKIGMGLLYLCTGGLFGIGWFIDIIWIAIGKFKDKYGLPLTEWDGN